MGKVVKVVVGVAMVVAGVITGNPMLILQGASMTLGAVIAKSNKGNAATNQRLSKQLAPEDFRKIIFGRTAGAADLRFWEVHGAKNTNYSEVIAVAGHRIYSFQEFYAEEEQVPFSGSAATGTYAGVLQRRTNTGAPGAVALSVGSGTYWNANSKFTGVAHYALQWLYDEKKLPNGIPQKVTQVIEGAYVYDPRRDSTRGGAGTHRLDDQSTWEYATLDSNNTPIGRNNALQALWYLIGWRVQNPTTGEWILVAGQGVDPIDIDMASFITGANDAEAQQFYTDMILSTGDSHATNRAVISCNDTLGRFLDPGGLWTYRVTKDDTAVPTVALTEDDVLEGTVEWVPDRPMSEQYNRVVGTYVDPSAVSLYQSKAYPQVKNTAYEAADGFKKRKTLNFQAIQDEALAQKAARIVLNEGRYVGEFKATFGFKALQAQVWDVVGLTLERYGFDSSYRFRVRSQSLSATGLEMLIRVTHSSVYSGGTVITSPAPSTLAKYDVRQEVPVEGLTVTQATLTGAGGAAQDAVAISWTAAPGNVRRSEGQFKLTAAATWTTAFASQADVNTCIAGPLLPSSAYQVRVRHVSIHEVPGPWAMVSLTTGANGRITSAAVTYADGTSIELLKPAEAGANVTGTNTAAAIIGQGTGATANNLAALNATEGAKLAGVDAGATAGDNMIRNAALATGATDWVVTMGTATRVTSTTAGDQPAYMRATGSTNLIALNGGGTGTSAIAVRGGTRIFLSWLARADVANVPGGGANARRCYVRVTYYNAAGSYIGIADISDAAKAATNGEAGGCSPNWELHSGFADAPAAAAFAQIAIFPLLGSTGAGKFIDTTKAVLTIAQAGADRTVDQLQAQQIQPRATVGENLMRNGDFFSGSDMWWTSPAGGYATADLAWRSGAAENVPGWLRYTAPAAGTARATYTPTRFDRAAPFNKDDGIPVIPGKEYWLQFVYRSDGNIQFGCDAWFYNGATQIAGAQPFIGGPFAPGGATFTANTSGAVVRAAIAKITVPAGSNIVFLRHTFARPGGSGATYGEISLVTLTAAEPGATVGARSGVNLSNNAGSAIIGDADIITSSGTAAAIAGQGSGATANNLAGLNAGEGAKLTGIESGATLGAKAGTNLVDSTGAVLGDSAIKNLAISIGSNGALTGAGGGQVTIGGLGYTGALDADKFSGSAADTKLTGIESGADVTKNAAVSIAPPPPQIIQRDWQGTPKSGQFNRVLTPVVTKGGTSIRTDNATTYSITTSGVTATVNNTNGSADKGRITMTAGGPGSISLTVTRDSIAYGPYAIPVTVEDDAPPANGGSTGGTDSTLEDVNSTSFVQMTSADSGETIFEATITAGQKLKGTAPLTYNWSHNSSSGTNKLVAKWQYSSDGGSTWNDFDTAITGSDASWSVVDLSGEPGSVTVNQEKSGLSAGTYKAKLVGAKNSSSGNAITIATGAATLSIS